MFPSLVSPPFLLFLVHPTSIFTPWWSIWILSVIPVLSLRWDLQTRFQIPVVITCWHCSLSPFTMSSSFHMMIQFDRWLRSPLVRHYSNFASILLRLLHILVLWFHGDLRPLQSYWCRLWCINLHRFNPSTLTCGGRRIAHDVYLSSWAGSYVAKISSPHLNSENWWPEV